ncbi:unnamed protein product [Choristocarpus tenellus]
MCIVGLVYFFGSSNTYSSLTCPLPLRPASLVSGGNTKDSDPAFSCPSGLPERSWLVFTAGAMGAGKSHVMRWLAAKGFFPLEAFVQVDPDRLRRGLPEMEAYLEENAETAGALTHQEAGLMAEILTEAALMEGRNVLVDGSLRNGTWYAEYIVSLRKRFPRLRVAIIHVWAPEAKVLERAARRAQKTGRAVPASVLALTLQSVPASVLTLTPLVDYVVRIDNNGRDCEVSNSKERRDCCSCSHGNIDGAVLNPDGESPSCPPSWGIPGEVADMGSFSTQQGIQTGNIKITDKFCDHVMSLEDTQAICESGKGIELWDIGTISVCRGEVPSVDLAMGGGGRDGECHCGGASSDPVIGSEGETWDTFRDMFAQTCLIPVEEVEPEGGGRIRINRRKEEAPKGSVLCEDFLKNGDTTMRPRMCLGPHEARRGGSEGVEASGVTNVPNARL